MSDPSPITVKYRFVSNGKQLDIESIQIDADTVCIPRGKGVSAPSSGGDTLEINGKERHVASWTSDAKEFTVNLVPFEVPAIPQLGDTHPA